LVVKVEWLWQIALKKAGSAIVIGIIALLSSPKVVEAINYLSERGFHVTVNVDQSVATVSMIGLLAFARNWAKVKMKASFL